MTVPPTGTLVDEAYSAIREEILRGEIRPGMPLSRRRLAEAFGMSVLPVSYALRRLEEDGLVESRARAGTRVRIPSANDIRDLYELREALEAQAARLFTQRATPAQRLELGRHAERVDVLFSRLSATDHDARFRFAVHSHHVDFHMRIADHSGSRLLKQIMERKHVLILNWLLDVTARRTPLPDGFHSALAERLLSGDAEQADAAMRAHVRYGFTEISGRIGALGASEWRERRPAQAPTSDTRS